jgi:hypothetical protein
MEKKSKPKRELFPAPVLPTIPIFSPPRIKQHIFLRTGFGELS